MRPLPLLFGTCLLLLLVGAPARAGEEPAPEVAPVALAASWRDQAEAAYGRQEYEQAITLYRRWLEADPRDANSWYNLACCYGLQDAAAEAVEAFETAVRAGWSDAEHPMRDPDLELVRDDPRFLVAVAQAQRGAAQEGPSGFERHWITYPTMGTYLALLPPDYLKPLPTGRTRSS